MDPMIALNETVAAAQNALGEIVTFLRTFGGELNDEARGYVSIGRVMLAEAKDKGEDFEARWEAASNALDAFLTAQSIHGVGKF